MSGERRVADLGSVPAQELARARAELRRFYVGPIRVRPSAHGEHFEARVPNADRLFELAVANGTSIRSAEAAGCAPTASIIIGVAGEGFEPSTFGL